MWAVEAERMMDNAKQRMIAETMKRRDEAVALLRSLLDAKSISEKNLAQRIGRQTKNGQK